MDFYCFSPNQFNQIFSGVGGRELLLLLRKVHGKHPRTCLPRDLKMYAMIKEHHAELSNLSVSALPDRVLTHTCSLLDNWPLILANIWCFPQPQGLGSFFTPSYLPDLVSWCWHLLCRPTLPMWEELIYEYETMLVPGDHVQPLESSGAPLMAQGKLKTSN